MDQDKIDNLESFEEAKYENIDLDHLMMYAIGRLAKISVDLSFENAVVASFKLFPKKFSLLGFPNYPDQPRKVCLFVYVKMIEGGSEIKISSENPAIHISADKIIVNEFDAIRHIVKHELEIWGEGAGQDAIIKAEYGAYLALLEVRIRSKEDRDEKSRKGMFSEPEYNSYEPEPRLDRIQSETYALSRKHGKKVHEVLVDQELLKTHQRHI